LAHSFGQTGDGARAIRLLEGAIGKAQGERASLFLALEYERAERWGDSIRLYTAVLAEDSSHPIALERLLLSLLRTERRAEAEDLVRNGQQSWMEAILLRDAGDLSGAVRKLEERRTRGERNLRELRWEVRLRMELGEFKQVDPLADELIEIARERCDDEVIAEMAIWKTVSLLLGGRPERVGEAARWLSKLADPESTSLRWVVEALGWLQGEKELISVDREVAGRPREERMRWWLLRAAHAKTREDSAGIRECAKEASDLIRGREPPYYLLNNLLK